MVERLIRNQQAEGSSPSPGFSSTTLILLHALSHYMPRKPGKSPSYSLFVPAVKPRAALFKDRKLVRKVLPRSIFPRIEESRNKIWNTALATCKTVANRFGLAGNPRVLHELDHLSNYASSMVLSPYYTWPAHTARLIIREAFKRSKKSGVLSEHNLRDVLRDLNAIEGNVLVHPSVWQAHISSAFNSLESVLSKMQVPRSTIHRFSTALQVGLATDPRMTAVTKKIVLRYKNLTANAKQN